jgi:hypothetical protein
MKPVRKNSGMAFGIIPPFGQKNSPHKESLTVWLPYGSHPLLRYHLARFGQVGEAFATLLMYFIFYYI